MAEQSIGQAENALRAVLDRLLAETGTTFVQLKTHPGNLLATTQVCCTASICHPPLQ